MNNNNTLIFEGAGWAGADSSINSGVGNCRIRTRIRNNEGRLIYLEMGGFEVSKNDKRIIYKGLNIPSHMDHCFYCDSKWDLRRNYSEELNKLQFAPFEYNKDNILKFVNENLDCSFNDIEVINEGLRVHDTTEPLCDCSKEGYMPYKDIEINISELEGIKPLIDHKDRGFAEYRISYDFVKELPHLKDWMKDRTEREKQEFPNHNYYASLRWNNRGVIMSLEISAVQNFCNMGFGSEVLRNVIDNIKETYIQKYNNKVIEISNVSLRRKYKSNVV